MGKCTQGGKAEIIKELRSQGHELKHLLKALCMPKSTYYYEISKTDAIKERDKEITKSELDHIKGIGKVKKQALLKKFGSVDEIKKAPISELLQVKGITKEIVEKIKNCD